MSVAADIRDAVVTAIVGAGLSGVAGSSVKHRKVSQRFPDDPDPLVIVTVGADKYESRNNFTIRRWFPVLVVLCRRGALVSPKSSDWMETARDAVHDALFNSLLLGDNGAVRFVEYDSDPPFSRDGFHVNDDVSAQLFRYRTEETSPQ